MCPNYRILYRIDGPKVWSGLVQKYGSETGYVSKIRVTKMLLPMSTMSVNLVIICQPVIEKKIIFYNEHVEIEHFNIK